MRHLWKSSIAKNIIGGFLIVLLPLAATYWYTNSYSMKAVREEVVASSSKSLLLLTGQLEFTLDKFEKLTYSLASDSELNAINQAPYDVEHLWEYVAQLQQLQFYSTTTDLEGDITIYLRNKDRKLSSKSGFGPIAKDDPAFVRDIAVTGKRWFFRVKPAPGSGQLASQDRERQTVITFVRGSGAKWDNGVIVSVDVPVAQLRPLMDALQNREQGTAFMFGEGPGEIFSVEPDADLEPLQQIIAGTPENTGRFTYTYQGERSIVLFDKSVDSGLTMGMLFPEQQIMKPIYRIRAWTIAVLCGSLVLGILYTLFAYRKLLRPVLVLVEAMGKVRLGQLKTRITDAPRNEFGFVYTQFNNMAGQIDSLVNEIYVERLNQQQAQLKLLQSQINPHFLYNCLNFIYQMSMGENNEGAARMSLYLSKYFRYATKSDVHFVSLRQELDNIDAYIQIQRMRFSGRITFSCQVPEPLLHTAIPRLTLQPLVENAFVHGIEAGDESPKHIAIYGVREAAFIRLTVEDDGKGLDQEELERIQLSLETMDHEDFGCGLNNTHWRLALRFGHGAGLRLERRNPSGLIVHILIPVEEGNTHVHHADT
ncbi:MAG: hypothetical protein K0R57_1364 [Paenibacillaceae bacterium]|jgi:two-component system sensor histidine kinase YesM|nr:hypothetical protein [Paenibacillaceae bacterium]